jgi:hypothetical protein
MEQPLPPDVETLLQDLQLEQTFNVVRKGQEILRQHPDLMKKVLEMQTTPQNQSAPPKTTPSASVERRAVTPRIESDERPYVREEIRLIQQGEIEGKGFGIRAVAYIIDIIAVNALQLVVCIVSGWRDSACAR